VPTVKLWYEDASGNPVSTEVFGLACGGSPRAVFGNIIYISINGKINNTLAHELGHAFGLGHADDIMTSDSSGYLLSSDNLMFSRREAASTLTLGQSYRINLDPLSMVNVNGLRVGLPIRACPTGCPRIDLGW
jgi:hypothetical protein